MRNVKNYQPARQALSPNCISGPKKETEKQFVLHLEYIKIYIIEIAENR